MARSRAAAGASNKKAFIAYLSSDAKGILDGAFYHGTLTQPGWYRFSDVDRAATFKLGFAAFAEGFITGSYHGVVRGAMVEPGLGHKYEIKNWRAYEKAATLNFQLA